MMAKGLGPLLLIGGAVAIFALSKKKPTDAVGGTVGGMRLIGDCEGIVVVDQGAATIYLLNKINEIAEREGFNIDTFEGLDLSNLEALIAEIFNSAFPQCELPPPDPDIFMMGPAEGAQKSWTEMIDMMLEQLGPPGALIPIPATTPGGPPLTMGVASPLAMSLIETVTI